MAARSRIRGSRFRGLGLGTGVALALALGTVACRRGGAPTLEDAAILAEVRLGLAQDLALARAPIRVDVEKGVVTLEGRVEHAELREEAERIARHVEGVGRVTNRIRVIDTSLPPAIDAPATAEP